MMQKPLRGPALNESVRNYVKQYILDRNLSAGDSLPPETQELVKTILKTAKSAVEDTTGA